MKIDNVAIIILNYISWEESLKEAILVHDFLDLEWKQIIIVDNASPNNSIFELEKRRIDDLVIIESKTNKGYASGNNIGLRYAFDNGYKYGWILNNDIVIDDKDVLIKMIKVFEKDDDVAVVNPDVYSPDGYMYNRDSQRPSFYDMTIGFRSYKNKGRIVNDLGDYGYIYRPQGCCMMVDLAKAAEVGFLDESTFLYCEEPIFAERLLMKNWKCACITNARIIHNHSKTVHSVLGKWRTILIQNRSYNYYLKEYRHFGPIERSVCIIFGTFKSILVN